MKELAATGADWVCISFATDMQTASDPEFTWGENQPSMVSDDEVRHAIDLARRYRLKVILKPVVNVKDGTWRAWIKFFREATESETASGKAGVLDPWGEKEIFRENEVQDTEKWERWWCNFSAFLNHYASIAEEKEVEVLCLGCEMSSTEQFEGHWRRVIQSVRAKYSGFITYDINHGRELNHTWWDAVDIISISGYYQVPPPHGVTIEEAVERTTGKAEIVSALRQVRDRLAETSAKWGKPILFIETGVTNVRGCARHPWSHPDERLGSPLDQTEQANYYEAFFEVFWGEPWFMGYTWWAWPAKLYDSSEATSDRGFCIYGKEAEHVLRGWYAKPAPAVTVAAPLGADRD